MRCLGIDIGGTKTLSVVVDDEAVPPRVVQEQRFASNPQADPITTVLDIVRTIGDVDSVGVGIAGLVSLDGTVEMTTHLAGVRGVPLRETLAQSLDRPVVVDNDATCAVVGEWQLGAGRGHDDLLVVTIGTGIGGGAVVGGRLARGTHGFAGEFGHIVVERGGLRCPCGRSGCWETRVSGRGLAHIAGTASSTEVIEGCRRGDSAAKQALDEFGDWAALGLHNLVNVFDPSCIVLGGGLGSLADVVSVVAEHFVHGERSHVGRPLPSIVAAELADRAGAIGAALMSAAG